MTDETYTKQLDDLKCQLASLVEHVALGNLSPNAICEELNGMKSDLELIAARLRERFPPGLA